MILAAAMLLAGWMASSSSAMPTCDTTWTNAAGGDWFVAGNWDSGVPGPADHGCLDPLGGTYTVTMAASDSVGGVTVGGSATLVVQGTGATTTLTIAAAGELLNDGTLELTTTGNGASEVVTTGATLTNNGEIDVGPSTGAGAHRVHGGTFVSAGTIDVNVGTTLLSTLGTGTLASSGTVDLHPTASWDIDTYTVSLDGGTVRGGGFLDVDADLDWNDGDIAPGTTVRVTSNEAITVAGLGNGTLQSDLLNTIEGTIGAAQTIFVRATNSNSVISLSDDVTNDGTIFLASVGDGGARLDMASSTLTNNGTIHFPTSPGDGDGAFYGGTLDNAGLIDIDDLITTFTGPGVLNNTGTIDLDLTATWDNDFTVVNHNGGSIEGGGLLRANATFNWNGGDIAAGTEVTIDDNDVSMSGTGSGIVQMVDDDGTFTGTIGPDKTLVIGGTASLTGNPQTTEVLFGGNVTNDGLLRLTTSGQGGAFLNLGTNTLTNNGRIEVGPSSGDGFSWLYNGDVDNFGDAAIGANLRTIAGAAGTFTNHTGATIDVSQLLLWELETMDFVSAGGAGTGLGTIDLGPGRDFGGSGIYTETVIAGATTDIDPDGLLAVGGLVADAGTDVQIDIDAGGPDRLRIDGFADLDGDLTIDFGAHVPSHCDVHQVVTWESVAGAFGSISLLPGTPISGLDITIQTRSDGIWVLVTDPLDSTPCITITPGGVVLTEGDAGSVVAHVPVSLNAPSPSTVTVDWTTLDTGAPGIATENVDYVADSGTLAFAPGQTEATIPIIVLGDVIDEPPALFGEWAILRFTNASSGATIDPVFFGLSLIIIIDDDP